MQDEHQVLLDKLTDIKHELDRVDDHVSDIQKRLYIDNGRPSIQTRLINLENKVGGFSRIQIWIGVVLAGLIGRLLYIGVLAIINNGEV